MTFDDLTADQKCLLECIQAATGYGLWPRDLGPELAATDAPAGDKAAVAEYLGGPGAGQEFLR